jgi:hypothetical protein
MTPLSRDHKSRCSVAEPATPIGEVVARLREGPLLQGAGVRSCLEEVVAVTLGEGLADRVRVGGVRQGKLVLFVDDPAYRFELQNYRYTALLEAVQRDVPGAGVGELQFRLSGPFGRDGGRSPGRKKRGPAKCEESDKR